MNSDVSEILSSVELSAVDPVVVPRRLQLAHIDTAIQLLLTAAQTEDTPEPLVEALQAIERLAMHEGIHLPFHHLRNRYDLSHVESNLVLVAASPQFRIKRGDRGPTVAEALSTVAPDPIDQIQALDALRPQAKLRRKGLVKLWRRNPAAASDDILAQELVLPGSVRAMLSGSEAVDEVLAPFTRLQRPAIDFDRSYVPLPEQDAIHELIARWQQSEDRPLGIAVAGDPGSGKSSLIKGLAGLFEKPLMTVDCSHLAASNGRDAAELVRRAYATAYLYQAWLKFDHVHMLDKTGAALTAMADALDEWTTVSFFLSARSVAQSSSLGHRIVRHIQLGYPEEELRDAMWRGFMAREHNARPTETNVRMLAGRFEMSPAQIRNAVYAADPLPAMAAGRGKRGPRLEELETAAYEQMRGDLSDLASVRKPRAKREDLVLPDAEMEQVEEIIRAARHRARLLHGWNFKERYQYGTGVVCLFSGEPGTGKTFCAEVIAGELGLDLYQIAVPQVVSKWVGETEKQISRIFTEAKASKALLLFDEADSLFGSRTEVRTASDRYANMATNYLLQAIESHEGVVVLTTNLEENLDSAAERRILFRTRFPIPDEDMRANLWRSLIPNGAPLADDVDFTGLAERFELAGGHIKNAIIRAAYDALHRNQPLDMETLLSAAGREARMTGRLVRGWN